MVSFPFSFVFPGLSIFLNCTFLILNYKSSTLEHNNDFLFYDLSSGQDGFIADEYSRFFLLLPNQTEDPSKVWFTLCF